MVALFSSYLFDHPEYLFNPEKSHGEVVDPLARPG